MEYNTERNHLYIPEYGRHIQKMVEHCKTIKDKDQRTKMAAAIVGVMKQVNGSNKDLEEENHKLWDHLFIISNYELDVDSPYPKPDKDKLEKRPQKIEYPKRDMKFRHYGKSIEGFIEAAKKIEDKEEKQALTEIIANMMKKSYLTWNRDSVAHQPKASYHSKPL